MAVYIYKAMTERGLIVRNKVEAPTKQILITMLKNSDLLPISIERLPYAQGNQKGRKRKNLQKSDYLKNLNSAEIEERNKLSARERIKMYLLQTQKITQRDLVVFTQNFYLLKKANFNNIHALKTLLESTDNGLLRQIIADILAGVEAGESMYTTMEYYEDVFPYIYVNMIKVGELSGSLTNSLEQAVKYLDDTNAVNKKLKTILIPNIVQFALLLVMLVVGTLVAIPAIQGVYEELGTQDTLPAITLWFQKVMNVAIKFWYVPLILIVGVVAALVAYISTPKGRYNFDHFKYKAPVFG